MKIPIIVAICLLGSVIPAFADSTPLTQSSPSAGYACGDHVCLPGENSHFWLQYLSSQKNIHSQNKITSPQSLDIFAPDGTCNIDGKINPGGTCSVPQMVLSPNDYASLQENPAIMAVTNINPTQGAPTTNICQIDNWIIVHEDGYFNLVKNETSLIDPLGCIPIPTPEFPSGLTYILAAIGVMITLSVMALWIKKQAGSGISG